MEAFGQSIQKDVPAETEAESEHRTANEIALHQLKMAAYGIQIFSPDVLGHKFGVPELPIARDMNHKTRYDPLITQCTKLLMRNGKLAKAQRVSKNPEIERREPGY
jgi:small subunit ribosomal protein S7